MKALNIVMLHRLTIVLLVFAFMLFLLSMVQIAFVTSERAIEGYWVLLTGWMGFIIFQFAWFANPLTMLALMLLRRNTYSAVFTSTLAVICSLQTLLFEDIPINVSGDVINIITLGTGFYYWVGMVICVFLACLMRVISRVLSHHCAD